MDIQSLLSYGAVQITVVKPGFGFKAGVYYVGRGMKAEAAVRLINNHNATVNFEKRYEDNQHKQPEVSNAHQERSAPSESDKAGGRVRTDGTGAESIGVSEPTIHKSDSGSGNKRRGRRRKSRAKTSKKSIDEKSIDSKELKDPWE